LKVQPSDALTLALDTISDRWSLHVVRSLALGTVRFTDIASDTGAPRDVLTARLRRLVEDRIVERRPYRVGSPREGYYLTEKGRDLARVILVIKRWGDTYSPAEASRRPLVHVPCGAPLAAAIVCQECRNDIGDNEIRDSDT
jgi:DNA-binding HxlR family transcriptional regulator